MSRPHCTAWSTNIPKPSGAWLRGSEPSPLATALVRVSAASDSLGRLCVVDPDALDVLDSLDRPVTVECSEPAALARSKHLALLRIAARDLLGLDTLEQVGTALADLARQVLDGAFALASARNCHGGHRHGQARRARAQLRE